MRILCVLSLLLGGCATLDFSRADVCLRKKLEVEVPLERLPYQPRKCTSKEVYRRIFTS